MADASRLQIYRCDDTCVVCVVGQGTMKESPVASGYVQSLLDDGDTQVVMDLSGCTFLDSTFLGCLIGLHKSNDPSAPSRFALHADRQQRIKLFSTTTLDRVFNFVESCPEPLGPLETIAPQRLKPRELGEHIMSCHQRLAAVGGKQASAYQSVADRLERELQQYRPTD